MTSLADDARHEQEIRELREALQRAQGQNRKLKRERDWLADAIYRAAADAAVAHPPPGPMRKPKADRRRKGEEVAFLLLTDWQFGKQTPSYNSEVAKERVRKAVQATVRIAEVQRADHPVRGCVVGLLGDLLENVGIFPGQLAEVDSGAYVQMRECVALIEEAILTLLEHFEWVHVHEVWGNHGRIGRKNDDIPPEDNLDRVIGGWARSTLRNQDRLTWEEPTVEWQRVIEIGDYRALLFHGHQIKGFSSLPAYAIHRKVTDWASGVLDPFHDAYCGHRHQDLTLQLPNGARVFMTPSTESGSMYATTFMASAGQPRQRLHFIDPKRARITGQYMLYLD